MPKEDALWGSSGGLTGGPHHTCFCSVQGSVQGSVQSRPSVPQDQGALGGPPRSIRGGGGGGARGIPMDGTSTQRNTQQATPQRTPMGCPRAPGGSPRLLRWCFDCGHKTYLHKQFFKEYSRTHFESYTHSGCLLCRDWSWDERRPGKAALAVQEAKRNAIRAKSPDAAAG